MNRHRTSFRDRREAAALLAEKLQEKYGNEQLAREKPLVLAIPRGGVVTGDEIASALGAELDVVVSKKVGAPDQPELALGAVMHDGSFFPNTEIIRVLGIPESYIREQIADKRKEIARRLERFRGSSEYHLQGRTVILTDDGVATGATVFAAIAWLMEQGLKKLIVAMPVGPTETIEKLEQVADDVVVLLAPTDFGAVGAYYNDFEQVSDDEVVEIMRRHRHRPDSI
jgi:predicted phosphoribosyltransferase